MTADQSRVRCFSGGATLLCLTAFVAAITLRPAIATAAPHQAGLPLSVPTSSSEVTTWEQAQGGAPGPRSAAMKVALKLLVKGIQKNEKKIKPRRVAQREEAAVKTFRKSSGRIADGLEDI